MSLPHNTRDRSPPSGYKLSKVPFSPQSGEPLAPETSNVAYRDIFYNANITACPGGCFRPVGLAFEGGGGGNDSATDSGRMFMSSDASGEIYVLVQSAGD